MAKVDEAEKYYKNRIGDIFLLFQCGIYDFPGEELFHLDLTRKVNIFKDENLKG